MDEHGGHSSGSGRSDRGQRAVRKSQPPPPPEPDDTSSTVESGRSARTRWLSARAVVACLSAVCVITVCAVAVSPLFSSGSRALNSLAERHAGELASAAHISVGARVGHLVSSLQVLQRSLAERRQQHAGPSFDRLAAASRQVFASILGRVAALAVSLDDGTSVRYVDDVGVPGLYGALWTQNDSAVAESTTRLVFDRATHAVVRGNDSRAVRALATPAMQALPPPLSYNSDTADALGPALPIIVGDRAQIVVRAVVNLYDVVNTAPPGSGGFVPQATAVGVMRALFPVDELRIALHEAFAAPADVPRSLAAVLLDEAGLVLAASPGLPPTANAVGVESPEGVALGCLGLFKWPVLSTGTEAATRDSLLVCRAHLANYDHDVLKAVPFGWVAAASSRSDYSPVTRVVKVGDRRYIAAAQALLSGLGASRMFVLVTVESETYLAAVTASKVVIIVVACALPVISALVVYALMAFTLKPLRVLANRMAKAAHMADDDPRHAPSCLDEIHELETAYFTMSDELLRVRSFLPAAVLRGTCGACTTGAAATRDPQRGGSDADSIHGAATASDADSVWSADESMAGAGNSRPAGEDEGEATGQRRPFRRGSGWRSDAPSTLPVTAAAHSDVSTRSERSSVATAGGVHRVIATTTVELSCYARPTNVSVMVCNLAGFHDAVRSAASPKVIVAASAALVDVCTRELSARRGVIVSLHGDRVTAAFNAAFACRNHAAAAIAAAAALALELPQESPLGLNARFGVASGTCLVGNMGSAKSKAFSVVGVALAQATVLERLAKMYGATVVTTKDAAARAAKLFHPVALDVVELPAADGSVRPTAIATVVEHPALAYADVAWAAQSDFAAEGGGGSGHGGSSSLLTRSRSDRDDDFLRRSTAAAASDEARREGEHDWLYHRDSSGSGLRRKQRVTTKAEARETAVSAAALRLRARHRFMHYIAAGRIPDALAAVGYHAATGTWATAGVAGSSGDASPYVAQALADTSTSSRSTTTISHRQLPHQQQSLLVPPYPTSSDGATQAVGATQFAFPDSLPALVSDALAGKFPVFTRLGPAYDAAVRE